MNADKQLPKVFSTDYLITQRKKFRAVTDSVSAFICVYLRLIPIRPGW